ncbi:Putative aminoglycoside phosphotransferase [Pelagimonas phthalicica]|uniref:Putative aminoglycoside phosphotransferase n=1 Tax=Pelagimonas phthalicica TaxID=1037362 RepID=A0A238J9V9_9RHOB|nr:phosphotransferase family protein [Pelagimonas phthalicica]TDS94318.1 aminoglycoside phosphotransferase (APT) family kinase protein [Pelagimonas phthalicica]SMX27155.1 Putative aminoglycoside phosphotransferase [Pelagimonas phthalicica]
MTPEELQRVSDWMVSNVAGFQGSARAAKFDVGQSNPTYRLETPQRNYVLRRKPPGVLLKSAHAVDREFRVQKALADSDVPVPAMLALCQDDTVLGTDFYIMEHITGRNIVDPSMPDATPAHRRAIIAEMARVLAAIHKVDVDAVDLSDYGPPGHYFERQLARWSKQYRASETETIPAMEALNQWLSAEMPADDGQRTLVHGDFRIDNLLFAPNSADCLAVLDWELSTLGHPFADLAGVIMQWQLPPGSEGRGLAELDRAALGLPSDAEFVADYCARRGIAQIANFGFYLAFAFFRMAAILQGVKKRALDGNAANPDKGLKLGAFVPRFAELGLEARDWNG